MLYKFGQFIFNLLTCEHEQIKVSLKANIMETLFDLEYWIIFDTELIGFEAIAQS